MSSSSVIRSLAFGLLLSLVAGTGCTGRYIRVAEKGLTCIEAHQLAISTITRLGYTVTDTQKPSPGSPGVVTGTRDEGTEKHTALVQVFCTTLGAEVEAKTDDGGLTSMSFASDFRRTFEAAVATRPPIRKAAESGVDVLVVPERGKSADFPLSLVEVGVLAVQVRISNQTPRTYALRTRDVVLQSADSGRIKPLAVGEVSAKLDTASAATLEQKVLSDRDVAPHETITGYLLFPFGAYSKARVVLKDRESGEPEGFSIEF